MHLLCYRGPDDSGVWCEGSIGFGQTTLRTGPKLSTKYQPSAVDSQMDNGNLRIVADARIDCRDDLQRKLKGAGRECRTETSDSQFILHAYAAWGEDCVQHLRGDFAFALWDRRAQKLFCARDHFGIKPFYYADLSDTFLFGNTLQCLRHYPGISHDLDDAAIGDFLLLGVNCNPSATSFHGIHRLPPAHVLTISSQGRKIVRYWAPPTDGEIRYQEDAQYVLHFKDLLRAAVADRVHTDRAAILLSGGLDSGSVAAMARGLAAESNHVPELRAYTITYESLFADREGAHARNIAAFLNIPIQLIEMDHRKIFETPERGTCALPEPVENPFFCRAFDHLRVIAAESRVALCGEGSDNLMDFQMWPYVQHLADKREWRRLAREALQFLRVRQFPWRGIRARASHILGADSKEQEFPPWIAPELERALDLRNRWREGNRLPEVPRHPVLPRAHASLALHQWTNIFENEDPGVTHCPVEIRYPFLDLRLVDFLLALPPFPWFFQKNLLRQAMIGLLPEAERLRPKTPLPGDPLLAILQKQNASAMLDDISWAEGIDRYVNRSAISILKNDLLAGKSSDRRGLALRPLCLNFWLRSMEGLAYKWTLEDLNESTC